MGQIYAGTSGFAYPKWKPAFYPAKTPQKQFLAHYASRLNSVEINYTFRRIPAQSTLENWFEQTEPGFLFTLKAHQKITHILRLKNAETFVELFLKATDRLRSSKRLGCLLFQLPPNLKRDDSRLSDFLALLPSDVRCAFEFRHDSWLDDSVYQLLQKHGAALCIAESEKMQVPEVLTADFTYWRLRMPVYTVQDRAAILDKNRELLAAGKDVYLYFKHEDTPDGALWAEELLNKLQPARVPAVREAPADPAARRTAV